MGNTGTTTGLDRVGATGYRTDNWWVVEVSGRNAKNRKRRKEIASKFANSPLFFCFPPPPPLLHLPFSSSFLLLLDSPPPPHTRAPHTPRPVWVHRITIFACCNLETPLSGPRTPDLERFARFHVHSLPVKLAVAGMPWTMGNDRKTAGVSGIRGGFCLFTPRRVCFGAKTARFGSTFAGSVDSILAGLKFTRARVKTSLRTQHRVSQKRW